MRAPALIPAPIAIKVGGEPISLHDGLRIEASDELAGVACWLRRVIEQSTLWRVEVSGDAGSPTASGNLIRLALDQSRFPAEAYHLSVGHDAGP